MTTYQVIQDQDGRHRDWVVERSERGQQIVLFRRYNSEAEAQAVANILAALEVDRGTES